MSKICGHKSRECSEEESETPNQKEGEPDAEEGAVEQRLVVKIAEKQPVTRNRGYSSRRCIRGEQILESERGRAYC
jgi:hypothetical protein